jgi:GTP:adenosylcobinamide-phosphate guanylyltransferase
MPITALLVAGRRPGIDPLAAYFGIEDKVLIPVNGEAMLSRVARTLVDHPAIARVVILAQEPDRLLAAVPWMQKHERITTSAGGASVSKAVAQAVRAYADGFPFLLTTADNILLDHVMIDAFIAGASSHDLAVALVERQTLLAAYPASQRTWLRFRDGAWSGANLFWFGDPRVDQVLALWQTIEQQRKKGSAIIRAFGPVMLVMVGLHLLTIDQAIARAGRRFGLDAIPVALPFAEACIDVDKPDDHQLASEILARRVGPR